MTKQREWDDTDMLDRLVDGELGDREYRELLLRLETQPDGWRRCALAFLEAQAWRREMRALRGYEKMGQAPSRPAISLGFSRFVLGASPIFSQPLRTEDDRRQTTVVAVRPPTRHWRFAEWLLAVAAGFLIAWSLGPLLSREALTASQPIGITTSVEQPASAGADPAQEETALQIAGLSETSGLDGGIAETEIVRDADGREWEIQVNDWSPAHAQWLNEEASAFPAELARALESLGTRIRRQRGLLPLETSDGRRVVVPIERVEITPVSLAQYR
jgi:hypothetical protein